MGHNRREHHVRARCVALNLMATPESDVDQDDDEDDDRAASSPRGSRQGRDQSSEMSDDDRADPVDEEEETYPQDSFSHTVTQDSEVDQSPAKVHNASQQARKKPRLVLREGVAELPRAAWDTDDTTDVFEQRSLGLVGSAKKFVRKAAAGGDSDDDDMFGDDDQPQSPDAADAPDSAPQAAGGRGSAKSRSMQIESDDEDE